MAAHAPREPEPAVRFGDMEIDFAARRVLLAGAPVDLTKSEFALLAALAQHPDRAIADHDLLTAMWGTPWQGDTSALQVHVSRLRRKLGESGGRPRFIRTVHGFGYRFDPAPPPPPTLPLSQTDLAALEESLPDDGQAAYLLMSPDRVVQWVSESVVRLLGWRPEELVGVSLYDLASPLQREEWVTARGRLDAGQPLVTIGLIRAADGTYLHTKAIVRPLLRGDGRLNGLLAEWRRAPATPAGDLLGSPPAGLAPISLDAGTDQSLLDLLLDSGDVFFVFDAEGLCRWASRSVLDLLGYRPEDLVGTQPALVHPDDRGPMTQELRQAVQAGARRLRRRVRLVSADGTSRWVDWSMTLQWRDDRLVRSLSSVRDVDAEVRARLALAASEERYRTLVAAVPTGIVVHAADGTIVSCNQAAEAILGLTADQLRGRTSIDPRWRAIDEDGRDFPGEEHPAMVTLRTGVPLDGILMGVHDPDGALRWISVTTRPFTRPEAPDEWAVLATFTDVTSLRAGAARSD